MPINTVGNAVLAAGILIILASLFADSIGIGGSGDFGPGQIMGLIVGPVIAFVGFKLKGQTD